MTRNAGMDREKTKDWRLEARLVRGGTLRTELGENSEAIFNTSSFVFYSAGQARE